MKLYRIENIKISPLLVLAHSYDDAANILAYSFKNGMQNRPDADFDVVAWDADRTVNAEPLQEWARDEKRGLVWCVDGGAWELVHTGLEEP